jgi:hypothetical protein
MLRRLIAMLLGGWIMTTNIYADSDWSLARERDGIKVWTKLEPNAPLRSFRATMTISSSLAGLVSLIMDTDNASAWTYKIERIDVLKRDDDKGSFAIRVKSSFPWPMSDRDAVVEGQIAQDENGVVTIRSKASPDLYPVDPDYIRMPEMNGLWTFKPLGNKQVEVTMEGYGNPGGSIPKAAINLLIHETPYMTLKGMRKVITDPKYQNSVVKLVKEPIDK